VVRQLVKRYLVVFSPIFIAFLAFPAYSAPIQLRASSGNILVNTATRPSSVAEIQIGGEVNLYFGEVTWSGGQVELYLSKNGYASVDRANDTRFGPAFSVAKIEDNATDSTTYPGYTVGGDWINGTIPKTLEIPGGAYYAKAYDGSTSAVAVTDTYLVITASFEIVPKIGPGHASIELLGYALPANGYVNLSYDAGEGWRTLANLYPADGTGRLRYTSIAPDLAEVLPADLSSESYSTITFKLVVNSTGQTLVDTFDEYRRGLRQVYSPDSIGLTAPSGYLYGNNTNFIHYGLYVRARGSLLIAGKWFSPSALLIMWDGVTLMGATTADENGSFMTIATVPLSTEGAHNVLIEDATIKFVFRVHCIPLTDQTAPKADAGPDQTVNEDTTVVFDGSDSTDNIAIGGYVWGFMDNEPKTLSGANPTYVFANPGVYLVTLNVTDIVGNWDTDNLVVSVLDITPPVANAGPDQTVAEDTLTTLNGSSSSDNGHIVWYVWTIAEDVVWTLTGKTATYMFLTPGVYTVTLNVTDAEGNWGMDMVAITVRDVTRPVAEAGINQTVPEGSVVSFNAIHSRDNLGIVAYEWDFGDGTRETGLAVNHTYMRSGSYNVSLTVKDQSGNSDTDSVVVTVLRDTDGDMFPDIVDSDDDNDGMPDVWEAIFGLNPVDPADAVGDNDWDGLTNLQEFRQGTNPNSFFTPLNPWIVGVALVPIIGVAIVAYLATAGTSVSKEEFVERELSGFAKQSSDIRKANPGYYEWKVAALRQEAEERFAYLRQRGYTLVGKTPIRQRLVKELKRKIRKTSR